MDSILLVGRGPSSQSFDFEAVDIPIMAVSSGIFTLPEGIVPEHFVSLDEPKFFMAPLTGADFSWGLDEHCRWWPFWREPGITKHVPVGRNRPVKYRDIPLDVIAEVPEHLRQHVIDAFLMHPHTNGFQPGWGDFPNVVGHIVQACKEEEDKTLTDIPLNFGNGNEVLGLDGCRNTFFFALQVAHRLGYRRLYMIGIDFNHVTVTDEGEHERYAVQREKIEKWYPTAQAADSEWINLAPESALAELIPTEEAPWAALEAPCRT